MKHLSSLMAQLVEKLTKEGFKAENVSENVLLKDYEPLEVIFRFVDLANKDTVIVYFYERH